MNEKTENPIVTPEIQDSKTRKKPNISLSVSILSLLIALVALVLLFTMGKPGSVNDVKSTPDGKLNIAWINTDTIWEQYGFVADVKTELATYEQNLQNQYASSAQAFQNEYNEYIKKASAYQLSLDEQKKTEEKLSKKQQSLQEMEAKLSQQLLDEKTARNMEVHDTIVNYIARFNKDKKYTFILERTYGGGLLWADSTLEITNVIIKGLNEEYVKIKKQKETSKEE